jgi:hypothetical protein
VTGKGDAGVDQLQCDTCQFWANVVVPCGPGMGCHVAPSHQLSGNLKFFGGPWVLNP